MALIHWLLNLSCFGVMLIPGRPEALAMAHLGSLTPLATAPVTAVVMYLYSQWLMGRADWLRHRLATSRLHPLRRLYAAVRVRELRLPWILQLVLVTGLAALPTVGLWAAAGFALIWWSSHIRLAAALIATANVVTLVGTQLVTSHLWLPSASLRAELQLASYVAIAVFLAWKSLRYHARGHLRPAQTVRA